MEKWEKSPPQLYDIVTGFFPETSPKETWATNPRPLLVCGRAQDPETGMYACRIAYGTTQHIEKSHENDLFIGNLSMLDQLKLKFPTRFVIYSGVEMVIMPWTAEFFRPWKGNTSPILSQLPQEMQRYVAYTLATLKDLPTF